MSDKRADTSTDTFGLDTCMWLFYANEKRIFGRRQVSWSVFEDLLTSSVARSRNERDYPKPDNEDIRSELVQCLLEQLLVGVGRN
jgi:hypothetical protein